MIVGVHDRHAGSQYGQQTQYHIPLKQFPHLSSTMGNKATQSSITANLFGDFEHCSGKMLIAAIRIDDSSGVQRAIETAKKEFAKPISSNVNKAEYDDMIENMRKYLTKGYDIGDGLIYTQSPIAFAKLLKSKRAEETIVRNLTELEGIIASGGVKVSSTVGEVSHERANLAKERLKAFRDTKK